MTRPFLGFGLGLRTEHYPFVIENKPDVDWFEVISENYMVPGGKPLFHLDRIRQDYPMVMHGVSMSIGSSDPLNYDYLQQLKKLIERVEPVWVSDHLCWTTAHRVNSHDLLPLPYNLSTISHVADRIDAVQNYLGRPILIENLSSYITYEHSEMTEWEFLDAIVQRCGCYVLLDINNIFVSAHNHHFDPQDYILGMDPERIMQFHLAGHSYNGPMIIDTHDHDVCKGVWDLYAFALKHLGPVSTMIERDDNIPEFNELRSELETAQTISHKVLGAKALALTHQPCLRGAA